MAKLSKEQEVDADLATAMGLKVISDPFTSQALGELTSSAEPNMALGQFVAQLVMTIKEQSQQNDMAIDDSVWLANGGVVDRLIDQLRIEVEDLGISIQVGDEALINEEVLNVLKLASKAGTGQPQAPQAAGPQLLQGAPQTPMGRDIGGMV